MSSGLLCAERVSRVHTKGKCVALRDVDLSVERGQYVAVRGPSGSGKSTLLHVLCGIDRPTRGRVLFDGQQPRPGREWARLRARRIGIVFQAFHLLGGLSAAQNVEIAMLGLTAGRAQRRRRSEELLDRVGLADRARHRPGELSGGEKQRLAIARSLANYPDVVLADEPTGNLDSATSREILDLLEELRRADSLTLLVVTHDPEIASRAGRTIGMLDGEVCSDTSGESDGPCAS